MKYCKKCGKLFTLDAEFCPTDKIRLFELPSVGLTPKANGILKTIASETGKQAHVVVEQALTLLEILRSIE